MRSACDLNSIHARLDALAAAGAAAALMFIAWLLSLACATRRSPTSSGARHWPRSRGRVRDGRGGDRSLLLALLVTAWALRLALHIGIRLGQARTAVAALRERQGESFNGKACGRSSASRRPRRGAGAAGAIGRERPDAAGIGAVAMGARPSRSPASSPNRLRTSSCAASWREARTTR